MPNHVHLILTPSDERGLALALSRARWRYSGFVNARARRTGQVFQGRYGSVAMDETHLLAAARYAALNPVRARLVADTRDRPHSSAAAHLAARDDELAVVRSILDRVANFADLLATPADDAAFVAVVEARR
jgi:putative transposase